jgi:hypothetical protein
VSAIVPDADGGRVIAYTEGDRSNDTITRDTPENGAIAHYERLGYSDFQRIHVVNSGCRGFVFRVWRSSSTSRVVAREVL